MIAYFDTSAFVKLLVDAAGSDRTADIWTAAEVVVASMLLYPETRAAIAAARRGMRLTEPDAEAAVTIFHDLVAQIALVTPTQTVLWRAGALAEVHGLPGYDSVHLASAVEVGPSAVMVTADVDLANAARAEGLVVLDPA